MVLACLLAPFVAGHSRFCFGCPIAIAVGLKVGLAISSTVMMALEIVFDLLE